MRKVRNNVKASNTLVSLFISLVVTVALRRSNVDQKSYLKEWATLHFGGAKDYRVRLMQKAS